LWKGFYRRDGEDGYGISGHEPRISLEPSLTKPNRSLSAERQHFTPW
jgi:hypothetical protein